MLASFLKGQDHLRVITRCVLQRRWLEHWSHHWILLGHTWQPTPVLICSCWSVLETPRELTAHPFSHPHLALHLWTLPAVFVPVSVPSLWESPGPVSCLLFLMHWPLHVCPQSLFLLGLAHYTSWKFLFLWSFHPGKLSMAEMGNGCSKGI